MGRTRANTGKKHTREGSLIEAIVVESGRSSEPVDGRGASSTTQRSSRTPQSKPNYREVDHNENDPTQAQPKQYARKRQKGADLSLDALGLVMEYAGHSALFALAFSCKTLRES